MRYEVHAVMLWRFAAAVLDRQRKSGKVSCMQCGFRKLATHLRGFLAHPEWAGRGLLCILAEGAIALSVTLSGGALFAS